MKKAILIIPAALILVMFSMTAVSQNMTVNNNVSMGRDEFLPFFCTNLTMNVTNQTAQITAAQVSIPANTIGSNGVIRATFIVGFPNPSGSNRRVKVVFGGTELKSYLFSTTSISGFVAQINIANRNNPASQVTVGGTSTISYGAPNAGVTTSTVDTTSAQTLAIAFTNQSGADSCNLESFNVEILKKN